MKTKLHFRAVGEKAFQPKLSALLVELDGHPCVSSTDIRLGCLVYELHLFCPCFQSYHICHIFIGGEKCDMSKC